MAKKTVARKPGRPFADSPKKKMISFRIDAATEVALAGMREKMGIISFSLSDVVREMTMRNLKKEGLL